MRVCVRSTLVTLALLTGTSAIGAADDEPVEYGRVRITTAEPPARFAAGWPSSTAALETWHEDADALPISHALDGLLAGDASLFERLAAASLAVSDAERAGWVVRLQALLRFKTVRAGFCTNARPAFEGPPSALREVAAASFMHGCLVPADRPLVLRADTPTGAVIEYFTRRDAFDDAPLPPWDDRLVVAVRAEYDAATAPHDKRWAAAALLRHPDPRAEAALLALYREAPPGDDRIKLAMLLRDGKSDEARAIGHSVCDEQPDSAPCTDERKRREFSARMRADGFEVYDEDTPLPPLEPARVADPPEQVRSAVDGLIALGFDRLRGLDPNGIATADPWAILAKAGLVHGFDVETGMFPNAHDSLMRELAALIEGAFAGALFDEIPPLLDEDDEEETGPYRLSIYLGGKRYRIDAANHGDWYDLEAVLELMKAVLADRGSRDRLFIAETDGQFVSVVAATPGAYRKAVAAKLFEFADPGAAEEAGKAYEAEVLDTIR